MSENEENAPSKQTSSVPLKKETVRVTLKAADAPSASTGESGDGQSTPPAPKPSAPEPPKPDAGAPKPPTPDAPKPPAPDAPKPSGESGPPQPTAPAAGGGAKPPAPAPTIPLKTAGSGGGSGSAPAPSPTIKLNTPGAPSQGGGQQPGQGTSLPKATVQLNPPTQPSGSAAPAASHSAAMYAEDEEEEGSDTVVNVLAGVGLLAAVVVLAMQLMTASVWISAEDNPNAGDWSQLF